MPKKHTYYCSVPSGQSSKDILAMMPNKSFPQHVLPLDQQLVLQSQSFLAGLQTPTKLNRLVKYLHLGNLLFLPNIRQNPLQLSEGILQFNAPLALHMVVNVALAPLKTLHIKVSRLINKIDFLNRPGVLDSGSTLPVHFFRAAPFAVLTNLFLGSVLLSYF